MRLFVGNLAYGATDGDLRNLFAPHGVVDSAVVARDRNTGRPKAFGFVTLATSNATRAAIAALNGKEVVGCTLAVRLLEHDRDAVEEASS